jgi:beta-phosphoglucomutase-like phosphatase (HAD superfamily)
MSWFDCEAILFDLDGVLVDSAYSYRSGLLMS